MIKLTILGEPVGKGRARTVRNRYTDKSVSFTPDKTIEQENRIAHAFHEAIKDIPDYKLDTPKVFYVRAYQSIPKSITKRKLRQIQCGIIVPMKKPDDDNIKKLAQDALNGFAYNDDCQVVDGLSRKRYAIDGVPRTEIYIHDLKLPTEADFPEVFEKPVKTTKKRGEKTKR